MLALAHLALDWTGTNPAQPPLPCPALDMPRLYIGNVIQLTRPHIVAYDCSSVPPITNICSAQAGAHSYGLPWCRPYLIWLRTLYSLGLELRSPYSWAGEPVMEFGPLERRPSLHTSFLFLHQRTLPFLSSWLINFEMEIIVINHRLYWAGLRWVHTPFPLVAILTLPNVFRQVNINRWTFYGRLHFPPNSFPTGWIFDKSPPPRLW